MATQQYKVGDLIMANTHNGYFITNTYALLEVVSNETVSIANASGWDIKVKIVKGKGGSQSESLINKVFGVRSDMFQPYQNGVLEWLHA